MKKGITYELDYYYDNPVVVTGTTDDIIKISSMNNCENFVYCKKVAVIKEEEINELQHKGWIEPINGNDFENLSIFLYVNKDNFYLCEEWKGGGFAMTEQEMAEDPDGPYCGFWDSHTLITHYVVCDKK